MKRLTSPYALTRCPKRVRLDFDGLPTSANGHGGNGNDYGNNNGWGSQVLYLPAKPLTPASSPDLTFCLAESTNPSTLPPHHVRPYSPPASPGERLRPHPRAPHRPRLRPLQPKPTSGTAKLDAEPRKATPPGVRPLSSPFTLPEDSPDIIHEHRSRYSRPKKNRNEGTPASGRLPFCGSKTKTVVSCDPSNIARGSIPSVIIDRDRTFVSSANITSQQPWTQLQARPEQIGSMFPSSHSRLQSNEDGFDVGRLLIFYLDNLCPGRNVLGETNPWPEILLLARGNTVVSDAISSAIRCLYGIYIYDYQPDEDFREIVCTLYTMAAEYYKKLLNDLDSKEPGEVEEFVALGVVLSTIHVVQAERRRGKPGSPSWLEGYKQCESLLRQTNPGGPFWENVAVQRSHLRDALSVIVGRGLIFSQLMAPLSNADLFDPVEEATRFNGLRFGNEKQASEIHGGCELSRQLMYTIHQVTYCASCLMQNPESIIFPITARFLLQELETIWQWSREHTSWEIAKTSPHPIEWIRSRQIVITESKLEVTEVTAEAWRITAIIYLLCRLFRLPRNHQSVVNQMDDLARCIRIIPTSGPCFTAQAPILPAFILGLLAINTDHKEVSRTWFEQVLRTPVRSVSVDVLCIHDYLFKTRMLMSSDQSVPWLFESLERTWCWIDSDVKISTAPAVLPAAICERDPWWEKLVAGITEREGRVLCVV